MPPTTNTISIPNGPTHLAAYLAQPTAESDPNAKLPGLVIIHEIFGLNDDIRSIADRFAAEGYIALAVDLFSGRNRAVCMFRFMGGMLLNSLNHGGIKDLKTALTYLAAQPNVDPDRLGAIGFCMGGNFAVCLACTDKRLKVVAPFYAANPRPLEAVARACPIVGSYPENDFTASQGRKLDAALDTYHIKHDIKIYPNAKHSFFNAGPHHNEQAAQDAWQRVLLFFREEIG